MRWLGSGLRNQRHELPLGEDVIGGGDGNVARGRQLAWIVVMMRSANVMSTYLLRLRRIRGFFALKGTIRPWQGVAVLLVSRSCG
jgi:hypothetical protein